MAKEIYRSLLIIALLAIIPLTTADALTITTTQKLVVLDPGHGGNDPGITSATNVFEKHIAMKLAQMTAQMLSEQYRFLLTRTTDLYLSAAERAAFANQNKADLFVSIHLHSQKKDKGFFFYFDTPDQKQLQSPTNWKTQGLAHQYESRQAATLFAKTFQGQNKKDRAEYAPTAAIPLEGLLMPAILAEPFTISHLPNTKIEQERFLAPYARMIAQSIEAYFQEKTR